MSSIPQSIARRVLACAALLSFALAGCRRGPLLNYPDGFREFAYVANAGGNSVTVLDLVFMRVDRTLTVPAPTAVVANPLRDEVYVASQGAGPGGHGALAVIATSDNHVRVTIPVGREPVALAVDPSGRRAFVLNRGSNSVSVVDLDSDRVILTAGTGQRPSGLSLSPDGRSLVVANAGSGSVSIYAAAVLPVETVPGVAQAPVTEPALRPRASFPDCAGAVSPVIPRDSSKAFIACPSSNQVMAVSLAAAPDSWNARQDASATTDHLLALLDVGQNPMQLTVKPDGGEVFASNTGSDSISEISTQTNEVESTAQIGNHPAHAVISGDSSVIWVADAGADSISLYSIDDGSRLPFVRTGMAPDALAFSADEALLLAADTGSGDVAVIRTQAKPSPGLLTILPAGRDPVAIAIKAMPAKP